MHTVVINFQHQAVVSRRGEDSWLVILHTQSSFSWKATSFKSSSMYIGADFHSTAIVLYALSTTYVHLKAWIRNCMMFLLNYVHNKAHSGWSSYVWPERSLTKQIVSKRMPLSNIISQPLNSLGKLTSQPPTIQFRLLRSSIGL